VSQCTTSDTRSKPNISPTFNHTNYLKHSNQLNNRTSTIESEGRWIVKILQYQHNSFLKNWMQHQYIFSEDFPQTPSEHNSNRLQFQHNSYLKTEFSIRHRGSMRNRQLQLESKNWKWNHENEEQSRRAEIKVRITRVEHNRKTDLNRNQKLQLSKESIKTVKTHMKMNQKRTEGN